MWINGRLLSLLSFVWLANAKNQNVLSYTKQPHYPKCNDTVIEELDKCWDTLPAVTFHGIPSDLKKIENACSVFSSGMENVDTWSKKCLSREAHEKLVNSVIGALQLYKFLCSDLKFRGNTLNIAAAT
ncbi:unnamed protein product [Orchesella dallaii]|uniref:Uncharacterized protein n=1 Tax=Orchesella dallaii TaxID=48710 RepID=A0ABP1S756_9HEXA